MVVESRRAILMRRHRGGTGAWTLGEWKVGTHGTTNVAGTSRDASPLHR